MGWDLDLFSRLFNYRMLRELVHKDDKKAYSIDNDKRVESKQLIQVLQNLLHWTLKVEMYVTLDEKEGHLSMKLVIRPEKVFSVWVQSRIR